MDRDKVTERLVMLPTEVQRLVEAWRSGQIVEFATLAGSVWTTLDAAERILKDDLWDAVRNRTITLAPREPAE